MAAKSFFYCSRDCIPYLNCVIRTTTSNCIISQSLNTLIIIIYYYINRILLKLRGGGGGEREREIKLNFTKTDDKCPVKVLIK